MRIARVIAASAAIALSSVDAFGESPQIAAVSGRDALAFTILGAGRSSPDSMLREDPAISWRLGAGSRCRTTRPAMKSCSST